MTESLSVAYNPLPYTQQKCLVHAVCRREKDQSHPRICSIRQRLLRDFASRKQSDHSIYLRAPIPNDCRKSRLDSDWKRLPRYLPFCHTCRYPPIRAERAIRPAVITRKISGGNRSPKGSEALSIITSVILQTTEQGFRRDWLGNYPPLSSRTMPAF